MTGHAVLAVRSLELYLSLYPDGTVHSHRNCNFNGPSSTGTTHGDNVHVLEQTTHTWWIHTNPFHSNICRGKRGKINDQNLQTADQWEMTHVLYVRYGTFFFSLL